jgi:hypothetical protein
MHLCEAHLPVSDTEQPNDSTLRSSACASRIAILHAISFSCGPALIEDRCLDCGVRARRWVASFTNATSDVSLAELLAAGERLNAAGIETQNFAEEKTTERSVIGWMPSAQLYFRNCDGHSLEFIALLDESPLPEFVGSLSEWKQRSHAK